MSALAALLGVVIGVLTSAAGIPVWVLVIVLVALIVKRWRQA